MGSYLLLYTLKSINIGGSPSPGHFHALSSPVGLLVRLRLAILPPDPGDKSEGQGDGGDLDENHSHSCHTGPRKAVLKFLSVKHLQNLHAPNDVHISPNLILIHSHPMDTISVDIFRIVNQVIFR